MDWAAITSVITALGGAGVGGGIVALYKVSSSAKTRQKKTETDSKERQQKTENEQRWLFIGELQKTVEKRGAQVDTLVARQEQLNLDLAVAKAAASMEQGLRLALQKQFDELSSRIQEEREDCQQKIAALQAEMRELRDTRHGPTPPPLWPPKQQLEEDDHAGHADDYAAG